MRGDNTSARFESRRVSRYVALCTFTYVATALGSPSEETAMRALIIGLALFATAQPAAAQQQPTPPVRTPERQVVRPPSVVVTPPSPRAGPGAPSGVSRVWTVTGLEVSALSGYACAYVTNLGDRTARVSARAVSRTGTTYSVVDASMNRTLGDLARGEQKLTCVGFDSSVTLPDDMRSLWLIINASEPVSVQGLYGYGLDRAGDVAVGGAGQIVIRAQATPIDCANPAGVEYACALAGGAPGTAAAVVRPR
jgi:hypothetical protein